MQLVHVVVSRNKKKNPTTKKLMAQFSDGSTIHFGAAGYGDYTIYYGKAKKAQARATNEESRARARTLLQKAHAKRNQYIARHGATENWTDPMKASTLARYILWEKPTVEAAVKAYRRRFS